MNSIKQTARTTGILYLVMFITAPIAILMVSSKLIVPDDAATTTANIVANEGLFRFSIAGHLVVVLLDLAISVLLYVILKPVNRILAMLAMASRLVMTAMRGINLVNYFIVLQLVNGVALTGTPDASHFQSLVMVYLNAFDSGFSLDLVFFALHLFLIGYLVFRSGFFPKILGILLLIASIGYLAGSITHILFPDYQKIVDSIIMIPNTIAELAFPLWLLIKGINVKKWEELALDSA
jgi:hypothetical protein